MAYCYWTKNLYSTQNPRRRVKRAKRKPEQVDVFVCVDCGQFLANGEPQDGGAARAAGWNPDELAQHWEGYHLVNGDAEKDLEFSWQPCEGCGTRLGGARMHCVAWEKSNGA